MNNKYTALFLFALLLMVSVANGYEKHIACGSEEPFDEHGVMWNADEPFDLHDAGYIGGEPIEAEWGTWSFGGTEMHMVHFRQRRAFDEYRFIVPAGEYIVRLELSECRLNGPGRRIFDIVIEDSILISDMDLYAYVGRDYAVSIAFYIGVYDETLSVSMPASVGEPILAGISVMSATLDSTAPVVSGWLDASAGYECNIVFWEPSWENDMAGYFVYRRPMGGDWETITLSLTPLHRYIDTTAVPGSAYRYAVEGIDVFGNIGSMGMISDAVIPMLKGATPLPVYELFIEDTQLAILADNPWSDDYVYGSFVCGADSFPYVEIRHRGNVSRAVSKKSWKVKFLSSNLFQDERKLNLASEFQDPAMLRNHYGSNLFCRVGIDAPYADFGNLWLNNEFYGVFLRLEQVDEAYLRHRGYSEDDIIYRCNWFAFYEMDDYSWCWEIETDADGFAELDDLTKLVTRTPDTEIEAALDSVFDVESLLRYYAVVVLIGDNDFSMHNIYLHREGSTGKWHLIPWDHNVAFENPNIEAYPLDQGTHYSTNTIGGPNTLWTRVMRVDTFRQRYCNLLDSLTLTIYTSSAAESYVDSITNYIRTDVYADYGKGTHEDNMAWEMNAARIATFVAERMNVVRANIEEFREIQNSSGVYINEICASNNYIIADEFGEYDDWLELYNSTSSWIDIGGWHLTDDLDTLVKWELPGVSIAPNGYIVLWLDAQPGQGELHGPFKLDADGEFVGLFEPLEHHSEEFFEFPEAIDILWFGGQKTDTTWARCPDGGNEWEYGTPTPGYANITQIAESNVTKNTRTVIQAYPNPFNNACNIIVGYPDELQNNSKSINGSIIVEICDINGRKVTSFDSGSLKDGVIVWRPENTVEAGIYLVRTINDDCVKMTKVIYLK